MPLGVCALKAYLKKNGVINTSVLDLNIKSFLNAEHKYLWEDEKLKYWLYEDLFYKKILPILDIDNMLRQIFAKNPDVIGFTVNAASIHSALYLIREIKKHTKVRVVAGGALCHENNAKIFLNSGVDAVVIGEGEETLLELVNDFTLHKGVYMLDDGKPVYGGKRDLLDIETLPFPDFDDIIDDYCNIGSHVWVSTSFVRGCPNKCAFCEESPFWNRVRQRSPEKIVEELTFLKERYNTNYFYKSDSILAANPKTLERVCDYIIDNNLQLHWFSQARLDKWLTKDLLVKMSKAGCTDLSFGAESGSQKVLDFMHKNTNVSEMVRIIKEARQAGINVNITLMVGAPKENLIDFLKP
ncbi:MAG: radical SAM protein [Candidatus Delongbacteria bacterium]|nr:radical SAM protein [Candidatus Delongbacteria bacterium]